MAIPVKNLNDPTDPTPDRELPFQQLLSQFPQEHQEQVAPKPLITPAMLGWMKKLYWLYCLTVVLIFFLAPEGTWKIMLLFSVSPWGWPIIVYYVCYRAGMDTLMTLLAAGGMYMLVSAFLPNDLTMGQYAALGKTSSRSSSRSSSYSSGSTSITNLTESDLAGGSNSWEGVQGGGNIGSD